MKDGKANLRGRFRSLAAALIVIALGVTLRLTGYDIGLPYWLVKYGGSALWGAMVYLLVASALPRLKANRLAAISAGIAIAVELIRLYHTPWLDAFRLTLAGALLLGRIFSVWNIVAYITGIVTAAVAEHIIQRRSR